MTASERDTLRGVIDAAKRARLARAGNPDLEDGFPDIRGLFFPCPWCGLPTYGEATCREHVDLPGLDELAPATWTPA